MKRVAGVRRVSTDRQKEEGTIEEQGPPIKEWVSKNDGVIVDWYDDDGWSGDILARPGLDRLRDDANKDLWDVVVFIDRDRLARKLSYQELIIDELNEKGKEIIFLNEPLAETMEGRIMQQVKGVFAEYEKAKIAERMRRGKLFKATVKKIIVNGPAPYGFDYISKTKDEEAYLRINEEEAKVVRDIFTWIADEKLTLRGVLKRLNENKILPKLRKREVWSNGPISRLVRNEVYIEKGYYNKRMAVLPKFLKTDEKYRRVRKTGRIVRPKEEWLPFQVPRIIDDELFYRVQKQLAENLRFNPRNSKAPYLLTGLVYCVCGRRRTGEGVREHRYYRCTDRIHNFPLPPKCQASGVDATQLDTYVWKKISDLLTNPNLVMEQADKWLKKQSKSSEKLSVVVERNKVILNKIQSEEARYLKAYGSGLVNFETFKKQMHDLKTRKEEAEGQISQVNESKEEPGFDLLAIENLSEKVSDVIKSYSLEEKQNLLRDVLETVTVGNSNKAVVKGYISVSNQAQKVGLVAKSRNCGASKCR